MAEVGGNVIIWYLLRGRGLRKSLSFLTIGLFASLLLSQLLERHAMVQITNCYTLFIMLLSFLKLGFSDHIAGGFEVCNQHCCGMKHIYHICAGREVTEHEMDEGQLTWVNVFFYFSWFSSNRPNMAHIKQSEVFSSYNWVLKRFSIVVCFLLSSMIYCSSKYLTDCHFKARWCVGWGEAISSGHHSFKKAGLPVPGIGQRSGGNSKYTFNHPNIWKLFSKMSLQSIKHSVVLLQIVNCCLSLVIKIARQKVCMDIFCIISRYNFLSLIVLIYFM